MQALQKKLGLDAEFAPPTKNALLRYQLVRLLRQVSPGELDALRWRPRADLGAQEFDRALKAAGLRTTPESGGPSSDGPELSAIQKLDPSDPALARRLHLVDPHRVLGRGYSILRGGDGRVLAAAELAPAGTPLTAELKRGRLRLRSEGEIEQAGGR